MKDNRCLGSINRNMTVRLREVIILLTGYSLDFICNTTSSFGDHSTRKMLINLIELRGESSRCLGWTT